MKEYEVKFVNKCWRVFLKKHIRLDGQDVHVGTRCVGEYDDKDTAELHKEKLENQ